MRVYVGFGSAGGRFLHIFRDEGVLGRLLMRFGSLDSSRVCLLSVGFVIVYITWMNTERAPSEVPFPYTGSL